MPQPPARSEGTRAAGGVAIPGVVREFLDRASIAYAGSRDASLVPHLQWVSGWCAEPEPDRVAFFLAAPFAARLLHDVSACTRLALTVEHIGPHETYQLKGEYADSRPLGESDRAAFESCRGRFVSDVQRSEQRFRFSRETLELYIGQPELAVVLEVHAIFVQTPGPGAGRRLVPPEDP